jgi:alpha-tubulin suppressor-like RCC1 family protein
VQIGSETDWTAIAAGHASSYGIRGGKLFAWGLNNNGQLGLGDIDNRSSPVQVGAATDWTVLAHEVAYNCMAIRNGALFGWGENFYGQLGLDDNVYRSSPVQVGSQTDWTMAAIGTNVSVGLRSGAYYVIGGFNEVGQFGDGSENNYRSSPVQLGSETNWLIAHIKFKSVFGIR